MSLLSIVIPLFNEEQNLVPLYQEIIGIIPRLNHFVHHEIIMVNDGSIDTSLIIIKQLAAQDPRIKIISFTRNFGHEAATYAGIMHAQGDAVVLIDADRQDPPELILIFEQEYLKGYDVVYGQRTQRLHESWLKKMTSYAFYPTFKWLTKVDIPMNVGDFCLISRKTVNCIKQMPERTIFIRGLIYWQGLPKQAIPFIRRGRGAGTSKYNYSKLMVFALENIVSFSTAPIYMMLILSFLTICFCCTGTVIALILHLTGKVLMSGWTSLIICMLFLFAATLFFLGILGLYVGKIFQEVKQRPTFLIDEKVNFDS